jgi:hypothetical protein
MGLVTSFALPLVYPLKRKMVGPQSRCDFWGEEKNVFPCSKLNALPATGKKFVKRTGKKIAGYLHVVRQLLLV